MRIAGALPPGFTMLPDFYTAGSDRRRDHRRRLHAAGAPAAIRIELDLSALPEGSNCGLAVTSANNVVRCLAINGGIAGKVDGICVRAVVEDPFGNRILSHSSGEVAAFNFGLRPSE